MAATDHTRPSPAPAEADDALTIAGRELTSRLLLGTGGFRSLDTMAAAIEASGSELVTVALRRIDPDARGSIVDVLDAAGVQLLPNTAGCFTARDAVLTAKLAREAFGTDWVKLEVIGDDRVGTASDAALAMELGCDAVLCASAVSRAEDPVAMARAVRLGVEGGRLAYRAGRIPKRLYAQASTPEDGRAEF